MPSTLSPENSSDALLVKFSRVLEKHPEARLGLERLANDLLDEGASDEAPAVTRPSPRWKAHVHI
jgi:hypothetical protein